jgi:hypothetical protein
MGQRRYNSGLIAVEPFSLSMEKYELVYEIHYRALGVTHRGIQKFGISVCRIFDAYTYLFKR